MFILENLLIIIFIFIEREEILYDFYICFVSWEISFFICKDVLMGWVKFGVLDDGKELV